MGDHKSLIVGFTLKACQCLKYFSSGVLKYFNDITTMAFPFPQPDTSRSNQPELQ